MQTLAIIDHEPDTRKLLRQMIAECSSNFQIVAEADNAQQAIPLFAQQAPNVVFWDLPMKEGMDSDLLKYFSKSCFRIVFITTYDEFILKAFDYNAIDYLIKPFCLKDLQQVLDKICQLEPNCSYQHQIEHLHHTIQHNRLHKIMLSNSEGLHIVPFSELIRLESQGNYTTFFTTQDHILVTSNLGEFEDLTITGSFFRVHQSHILNLHFVRKVLREDGGSVLMQDGSHIPIARRRKEAFIKALLY